MKPSAAELSTPGPEAPTPSSSAPQLDTFQPSSIAGPSRLQTISHPSGSYNQNGSTVVARPSTKDDSDSWIGPESLDLQVSFNSATPQIVKLHRIRGPEDLPPGFRISADILASLKRNNPSISLNDPPVGQIATLQTTPESSDVLPSSLTAEGTIGMQQRDLPPAATEPDTEREMPIHSTSTDLLKIGPSEPQPLTTSQPVNKLTSVIPRPRRNSDNQYHSSNDTLSRIESLTSCISSLETQRDSLKTELDKCATDLVEGRKRTVLLEKMVDPGLVVRLSDARDEAIAQRDEAKRLLGISHGMATKRLEDISKAKREAAMEAVMREEAEGREKIALERIVKLRMELQEARAGAK